MHITRLGGSVIFLQVQANKKIYKLEKDGHQQELKSWCKNRGKGQPGHNDYESCHLLPSLAPVHAHACHNNQMMHIKFVDVSFINTRHIACKNTTYIIRYAFSIETVQVDDHCALKNT